MQVSLDVGLLRASTGLREGVADELQLCVNDKTVVQVG
jgi:hypothetical protein